MYKIFYSPGAIKSYSKLPERIRRQLDVKILVVAKDPYAKNNNIAPICGRLHCYRLRVGDWRVIYEITQQELKVYVIKVAHRSEVYKL